jgi:hypothetical protein
MLARFVPFGVYGSETKLVKWSCLSCSLKTQKIYRREALDKSQEIHYTSAVPIKNVW